LPETRAGGAELVVLLALLRVGQQIVRRLDVLEPLFRLRVVRVAVGVEVACELAIGLLYLVVAGGPRHAQHLIRITGHWCRTSGP
jgi:hypothetical protein